MSAFFYRWRGGGLAALFLLAVGSGSGDPWIFWMLPVVFGILLRIWARCHIGIHSRGDELEVPTLSRTGPYALIRHPLYLSNTLVAIGYLSWWMGIHVRSLVFATLIIVFYRALAHWEDMHLEKTMGETWSEWKTQVPGVWCPRRWNSLSILSGIHPWKRALFSDRSTWFWLITSFAVLSVMRYFHVA